MQVDRAIYFSTMITVAAFIPLFTMQGVEGQIFGPMARTYGYALVGALIATFTISPVLASYLLPDQVKETETIVVRALRSAYTPVLRWGLGQPEIVVAIGLLFLAAVGFLVPRLGTEFLPALEEGNLWIRASMPPTISLEAGHAGGNKDAGDPPESPGSHHRGLPARQARRRQRRRRFLNAEFFVPLKPFDQWPSGMTKENLVEELQTGVLQGIAWRRLQLLAVHTGQHRRGPVGRQGRQLRQDRRPRPGGPGADRGPVSATEMDQIRGVEDLGIFRVLGQPNLNIKVDRAKAARYGLNAGDLNTVVQTALGGTVATTVLEGDRQFNLTVRLSRSIAAASTRCAISRSAIKRAAEMPIFR